MVIEYALLVASCFSTQDSLINPNYIIFFIFSTVFYSPEGFKIQISASLLLLCFQNHSVLWSLISVLLHSTVSTFVRLRTSETPRNVWITATEPALQKATKESVTVLQAKIYYISMYAITKTKLNKTKQKHQKNPSQQHPKTTNPNNCYSLNVNYNVLMC